MPQASTSLLHRLSPLASASEQLRVLDGIGQAPKFNEVLRQHDLLPLIAEGIDILQVNVGKLCNMTCQHCHVDAGPDRREMMTRATVDACLNVIREHEIGTLDLTGGAPEMNPHFRYFVTEARKLGTHVIDRCNLTILLAQGYEDLADFLAEHDVEIVASLPCYLEENTDKQRGDGAYRQSIAALKQLNARGYGTSRTLTLVYNPIGASLPPDQSSLEEQYREYLKREHGIEFTRLFTITNMPISRFLEDLMQKERVAEYMQKLLDAFNPAAAQGVMCRKLISVGWDGQLFDCDFNQMLSLPVVEDQPKRIQDFSLEALAKRTINVGRHCFGCTAAAGSGCLGAIETSA